MAGEIERHLDEPFFAQDTRLNVKNNQDLLQAAMGSVEGPDFVLTEWRQELVETIHFLHAKGWAPATSSNYSIRPDNTGEFWISSSGIDKGALQTTDLMCVDSVGKPILDSRKASAETRIHCAIYDLMPQIRCVLHTHSIYNTVLSEALASEGILKLEGFEILKGLAGISTHEATVQVPIIPNTQDMEVFTESIKALHARYGDDLKGYLIQGHGLYTWGRNVAETKRHVEVFEFLFEVIYKLNTYRT